MPNTSLNDIIADFQSYRDQPLKLNKLIDVRHKLTANIQFNLYGSGNKEEGRKALEVRNTLDETVFNTTAADMVDGTVGGLEHMKKGILLENLAEKMEILENVVRNAKAVGMKAELISLLVDSDRFNRFNPTHKNLIKSGATGFAFLANWRVNKVIDSVQQEVKEVQS